MAYHHGASPQIILDLSAPTSAVSRLSLLPKLQALKLKAPIIPTPDSANAVFRRLPFRHKSDDLKLQHLKFQAGVTPTFSAEARLTSSRSWLFSFQRARRVLPP